MMNLRCYPSPFPFPWGSVEAQRLPSLLPIVPLRAGLNIHTRFLPYSAVLQVVGEISLVCPAEKGKFAYGSSRGQ